MASYYVIGDNGSKFGPADEFLLQEWIGQNRLSSKMQLENAKNGQKLLAGHAPELMFPESQRLAPVPTPVPSPAAAPALAFQGAGGYAPGGSQQWNQAPTTSNYYRPSVNVGPEPMPASDKNVGITLMVLAGIGAVIFMILFFFAASFDSAAMKGGAETKAVATGFIIGLVLTCGLVFAIGNGIRQSRKWAFITGIIFYSLNILGNLAGHQYIGVFISAWILYYCISRMTGKKGPLPA
jgi:hypothetical protein